MLGMRKVRSEFSIEKTAYAEIPESNQCEDKELKHVKYDLQIIVKGFLALQRVDQTGRDNIMPSNKKLYNSPSLSKGK